MFTIHAHLYVFEEFYKSTKVFQGVLSSVEVVFLDIQLWTNILGGRIITTHLPMPLKKTLKEKGFIFIQVQIFYE
jgi:hypothetical protein